MVDIPKEFDPWDAADPGDWAYRMGWASALLWIRGRITRDEFVSWDEIDELIRVLHDEDEALSG